MEQIFIKGIEKLTEPIAIIALLLMVVVIFQSITIARAIPKINSIIGKQTTLLEILVYGRPDKERTGE